MATIGIMGGTFNPIHIGHIKIAEAAYAQFYLDEIWFMPNHIPAYKSEDIIVSGEDRLAMVELAIQDIPHFKSSDFELKREGNTYTAETLQLLKQKYPKDIFYFIMGADSLFQFDKWKDAEMIPGYAELLIAPRDGKSINRIEQQIGKLNTRYGKNCFHLLQCKEIPCSSSDIRESFYQNLSREENISQKTVHSKNVNSNDPLQYLPDLVYKYIIKKHLYEE